MSLLCSGKYYGYMSRNEVHLVDHKPNLFEVEKAEKVVKCSYAEKDPVSSIDQAALKAGSVLLVANTVGMLLVCDETGEKPLHSHKLQKSQGHHRSAQQSTQPGPAAAAALRLLTPPPSLSSDPQWHCLPRTPTFAASPTMEWRTSSSVNRQRSRHCASCLC